MGSLRSLRTDRYNDEKQEEADYIVDIALGVCDSCYGIGCFLKSRLLGEGGWCERQIEELEGCGLEWDR